MLIIVNIKHAVCINKRWANGIENEILLLGTIYIFHACS